MLAAYLKAIHLEAPGAEDPSATRERLKERFPKGATRRMTQLGLLVGSVLEPLSPGEADTLVYASEYAETRALEGYLDSFPTPSPTLFQTSIHPSAVQQYLIQRQQPVRTFFPMTGRGTLVAQACRTALLAESDRVIVCGGEERGTWLLEREAASAETFAFALVLERTPDRAIARLALEASSESDGSLTLSTFFRGLQARASQSWRAAAHTRLCLTWL